MPEMAHEKRDARDLAQKLINWQAGKIVRRMKVDAMTHIDAVWNDAENKGLPFNSQQVGIEAAAAAEKGHLVIELEPADAPQGS